MLEFKTPNDLYDGDKYVGALYSTPNKKQYRFIMNNGFSKMTIDTVFTALDFKDAQTICKLCIVGTM